MLVYVQKSYKKFIDNLVQNKSLPLPRKIISMIVVYAAAANNEVLVNYQDKERAKAIKLIRKIKNEVKLLMEINEAYQVYMAVKRTKKIKGDIAEVGVYRGGSAKIISKAKGDKALHLFDTFEGLPELSRMDQPDYFYKGLFPVTAKPVKNKKFSFVNLDVDIYQSTLNCLEFFYPRMSKGGIIISHDYINAIGVRKAFDDFFKEKLEPIIELSGSQCLIVKV